MSCKFATSVYRKPTFSGIFNNYESFIPTYQKRGLLHTLIHRSFRICYDFKTFHFEIDHLKTTLIKNYYPLSFIDSCIKSFLSKLYTPKVMAPNLTKRNVFVKLPLLGSTCYFQDLFTSICVVTVMLPIMKRPNVILKSEFVNLRHFTSHCRKGKDKVTTLHPLKNFPF